VQRTSDQETDPKQNIQEKESLSYDKKATSTHDPSLIFEKANGIQGFLDTGNNVPEGAELVKTYSIDNELALKEFINVINEKDRGIPPEPIFDLGSMIEQLAGKAFDTMEDATLMFKRQMAEFETLKNQDDLNADALSEWNDPKLSHKPKVLVVGSGWASHAFIKCIDTEKFRVLVVSPTNYFVFTPMLASTSVGTTEARSIVESTRESNPTVKYLEGKVMEVDVENKSMKVKLGQGRITDDDPFHEDQEVIDISYDVAVYSAGVGPLSASKRTQGLSKDNVHFLKTVEDAKGLLSTVITLLEKASQPGLTDDERRKLLTFVVVGGGPTGVEYCGELTDFINDVTGKERKNKRSTVKRTVAPFASLGKYTSVKLIQGSPDLLPMFDKDMRDTAKAALVKEGVDVRINTKVNRIEGKNRIIVTNPDGEEVALDCGIIVWAAGTMPLKLTGKLIEKLDEFSEKKGHKVTPGSLSMAGRIPVDRWQRVLGAPAGSLLAIGDASGTVGENASPLPQTAQVAAQQGAYVARLLNRGYDLTGSPTFEKSELKDDTVVDSLFLPPPINHKAVIDESTRWQLRGMTKAKPFQFLNLGQLAYIGGGEALSQVQLGNKKLFNQAGSVGFLLWKSVYVVKQVSTKTRLLVLFDWFKTKIFGRDVTRM
jgi:NADH dehydrogenase FAD-containing subunit